MLSLTHIFDGTHFARWKRHMPDHFRAMGSKFWWIIVVSLTHVLDHRNMTQAQKVCFELDAHAYCYLMVALSFEVFNHANTKGSAHDMWESIKHLYGDSSTWDDGKFKKEDDHKEIVHEDVEHIPNTVIVEVCALPRVHFINVGWLPLDGLPISQCAPMGE
jgi:hypothetical protein